MTAAGALAIVAGPCAAAAQPPGAAWPGDICRQPASARVQCLSYPPRIAAHERSCRWVSVATGGAARQFEACRDPDGAWRPSGRS
jgi:hypothetical protein